jgi:hypothetical protein
MLHVLQEHEQRKMKPGRPAKLSLEHQLLMTLPYWREYRTYFHIRLSWGVAESVVCRTVQRLENLLIKSKGVHWPGKKKLPTGDTPFEVIMIEVAESPVERPQKNSGATPAEQRGATLSQPNSSSPTRRASSSVSRAARDGSTIANCSSGASSP